MIVKVQQGLVDGDEHTSVLTGEKYYSFLGIPYAEPPVGDLRFRPPVPIGNWDGVYDAKRERNICIQGDHGDRTRIIGSEDCLYLNVFTPQLPSQNTALKAVMVYIHGGAFLHGSGSISVAGPDYLIKHDVVVIAINYRLQILGFLNMGTPNCLGNCGLKDLVAALKWIKENVRSFGGDPNRITIFGESSGGFAVHALMLSPLSQGLFHRIIAQGGTIIAPVADLKDPMSMGFRAGQKLGFQGTDPEKLVDFLKKQSAANLCRVVYEVMDDIQQMGTINAAFVPSVEKITENAVLPDHSVNLIKAANPMPIIAGVCEKEGIVLLPSIPTQDLGKVNEQFTDMIGRAVPCDASKLPEVASKIKNFYFGQKPIGWDTRDQLLDLLSDLCYFKFYDSFDFTNSGYPVYMYEFTFNGRYNFSAKKKVPDNLKGFLNASIHSDELGYLFYRKARLPNPDFVEPEKTVLENICKLWTNFAKTGNPTPDPSAVGVEWKPSTVSKPMYLKIDRDLKMTDGEIWAKRRAFWKDLFLSLREQKS